MINLFTSGVGVGVTLAATGGAAVGGLRESLGLSTDLLPGGTGLILCRRPLLLRGGRWSPTGSHLSSSVRGELSLIKAMSSSPWVCPALF